MLKNNTRIVSWGGIILALAGVVIAFPLLTKTSAPQAGPAGPPGPPQVGVISLKQLDVLRATELPGRTAAVMTSEVRPQVNGVILKRLFTEGSDVKEGQQLYQIDPATYKAAYDNAVAALDKAKAALATAQAKAVRYKKLIDAEMISRQDYDDVVATARQDQADIASAEASVEQTRINLGYTKVFSPISGRIGHSAVTPGALVTQNQTTALATVTQLDPLYVDLNQSSATLLRLRKEMEAGEIERVADGAVKVTLKLEDGSVYPASGTLKFTEATVDQGTGTVLLRAQFPNPHLLLMPGMYVHAVIYEGMDRNGLTVPQKAVSRNTRGEATVLVIEEGNKVALRVIQIGSALGNQWIVTAGLRDGDKVLVDGTQNVRPGSVVEPLEVEGVANAASDTTQPDRKS
ncbi:MAG: efflux RND transporter periplasmic adaptor subunit [Solidesulfovibrio sp.]